MRNVVLPVDMVKGFHNQGNLQNPRTATIIPHIDELLERKSKMTGWLEIFMGDAHEEEDREFLMYPKHCVKGTEEAEVISELSRFVGMNDNLYLPKTTFSCFYQTGLQDILSKEQPEKIIVVGVCTDICVLNAVTELRIRGYQVFVPADCVETYSRWDHDAVKYNEQFLRYMRDILGTNVVQSQKEI